MYLFGILCLVAATAALPVLPDPPTLPNSVAAAHQGSEMQIYNQPAATASASLQDIKDNEEVKKGVFKIGSVIFPPPPQLHLLDYSVLRKQKAAQKQKYEDTVKQKYENAKKEKEYVIPGKPIKVEVPPNPATLTAFVTALEDSEGRANIIHVGTDCASVADKKDYEEVEHNWAKIATVLMPSSSELPSFDYSILRQQKADYNLKPEHFTKHATEQSKEDNDAVILDLENPVKVEVPANLATLIDPVTAPQDCEICSDIFIVATDSNLVTAKKDNEEVKPNKVKIASIDIPAPPELSVFDYSTLEKQIAAQKQKSEEALKQKAKKFEKLKEVVISDQENPVEVRVQPNAVTLTGFVPALEESEGRVNIIHEGSDSAPVIDEKDDEEVEHGIAKIATVVIPSPPELRPFDYSILRQQKAEYNQKSEYSATEAAEKSKKEKEALMLDLEKQVKVEVPANPATLIDSVTAAHDSKVRSNIFIAATDSALVSDKKYDEVVKPNVVKMASIVIPAPPELPPFDYSILEKQLADQKQKSEEALKQEANKSKKLKEAVILDQVKPVKVRVGLNPATLTSFVPALEESEGRANIIHVGTVSAPVADEKDDEEVEHSMAKITTIVIPSPPELPPFDYSILRQQKAEYNLKSKYSATKAAEKSKKEKEALMLDLEKPVKVKVPANPATLIDSVTAAQDSEVRSNIFIAATNSALVADKKYDEEVKPNMVKIASIVIPAPPELPPFDYSILEKQLAEQKQKSEEALKQEAKISKKLKEAVILDQVKPVKVRVRPNPATLTSFVPALEKSEGRANIIQGTVSAPVADEKDDEEVEHGMAKIATIVIPSPPELPPFDYSILRQQKAEYNLKSKYSATKAAEKSKKEKEALMLDLEKPVKVKVPANPATLIDSVTAAQDSEVRSNIFIAATNSALVADKKYDEEVKPNMVKIASIVIPAPPELPPFDYSILEKQLAEQKQKSEEALKQEAKISKKLKEAVILDQVKPVKVRVRPNPATLTSFVPALEKSEGRANIIQGTVSAPVADEKDDEEVEHGMAKIATIVIPSPPELPPFDYSILRQQKAEYNLKSDNFPKFEADKFEKEKDVLIIEKPDEVKEPKQLEESQFVKDSYRIEESKPVEESKLIEVLKKEPVKHLEDIPITIQWTITSAPLIRKLISNNPLLPSFGLNWPLHKPSKSGHSCIICQKFKRIG